MAIFYASENTTITLTLADNSSSPSTFAYAQSVNTGAEHNREKVFVLGNDEAVGFTPGVRNIKDSTLTVLKEDYDNLILSFGTWKDLMKKAFNISIRNVKEDGTLSKLVLENCYFSGDDHTSDQSSRSPLAVTLNFMVLKGTAA